MEIRGNIVNDGSTYIYRIPKLAKGTKQYIQQSDFRKRFKELADHQDKYKVYRDTEKVRVFRSDGLPLNDGEKILIDKTVLAIIESTEMEVVENKITSKNDVFNNYEDVRSQVDRQLMGKSVTKENIQLEIVLPKESYVFTIFTDAYSNDGASIYLKRLDKEATIKHYKFHGRATTYPVFNVDFDTEDVIAAVNKLLNTIY